MVKIIDKLIFGYKANTLLIPVQRDELIEELIKFYEEHRKYGK